MLGKTRKGISTRSSIIAAARRIFRQTGVSSSGLHDVACAADVTRGAVYWYFENKLDLFEAMLGEVPVPLVSIVPGVAVDTASEDPLEVLRQSLLGIFHHLERDRQAREILEIILFRCELVGEFAGVQATLLRGQLAQIAHFERLYEEASATKGLRPGVVPRALAMDTAYFICSLVRAWLADSEWQTGGIPVETIDTHIALRRAVG